MSHLKIHHLAQSGISNIAIATAVGCSVRTVYNALKSRPPTREEIAAGAMQRAVPMGRPAIVTSLRAMVEPWLMEDPVLRVTEVGSASRPVRALPG